MNQNDIPIESLCLWAHLALIMSLTSMKMLTNMTHMQYIQDNAMLKPSWKFGESKWNPCWGIVLMSSSGTNYVPRAWRYWPIWLIYNLIWDNAMLKPSWKFGEWKWNPCWVIVLTSSSGTNHVPNKHEDVDQYDSYAIPSKIMPYQSYPKSFTHKMKSLLSYHVNELIWH